MNSRTSSADGLLPRVRQGVRLARSGAPRLLDALLLVQVVEALALAASVQAIQRLAAALLTVVPGHALELADLVGPGAVLLLAVSLAGICQAAQPSIALILGERLAAVSAAEVLAVAGTIELADFDRPEVLDRLKRVEFGAMVRPAQLAAGLGILLSGTVGAVALTIAVLAMQPWLAVAAAVAAAPLWWAAQRDGASQYESVRGLSRLERRRMYLAGLLTSRERAAEVRALELTPVLLGRYRELSRQRCIEVTRKALDRARRQLAARAVGGVLLVLGVLGLVAMLRAGTLSLADAVAAGAAGAALRSRLADAAAGIRQLQEAAEFVDDHAAVMRAAGAARDLETTLAGADVEPLRTLALRRVSMVYPGMDTPALRDVDLELRVGEVLAVVGANGSGKSTLAALIAGLLTPTSGAVTRNGVDLRQLPTQSWRPDVSVLLQGAGRYQESVRDNVSFGDVRRPADDQAVVASLTAAGAHSFLALADEGLDAQLGREQDGGLELSGGQWQRVALARTFYRGGRLLILDEPSAALDPMAERDLVDRMRRSFTDRAVLLITHRMSAARTADRIVVLDHGSIIEEGTPAELLLADGAFARLCLAQSQLWEEQPQVLVPSA